MFFFSAVVAGCAVYGGARSGERGRTGGYTYLPSLRDVRSKTAGDAHQTTIARAHHREENQGVMKMVQKRNRWQRETIERTSSAGSVH